MLRSPQFGFDSISLYVHEVKGCLELPLTVLTLSTLIVCGSSLINFGCRGEPTIAISF